MNIRTITEEEVRARWVQRLSDTPNRLGRFGTAGMTAAEMKAAFDALPLLIVGRFNALIEAILSGEVGALIPIDEERSLADRLAGITDGRFAELLTVDGTRTLTALAAALDTVPTLVGAFRSANPELRTDSEVMAWRALAVHADLVTVLSMLLARRARGIPHEDVADMIRAYVPKIEMSVQSRFDGRNYVNQLINRFAK